MNTPTNQYFKSFQWKKAVYQPESDNYHWNNNKPDLPDIENNSDDFSIYVIKEMHFQTFQIESPEYKLLILPLKY